MTIVISAQDRERWLEVEEELRTRSPVSGGGELLRPVTRQNAWTNYCTALKMLKSLWGI